MDNQQEQVLDSSREQKHEYHVVPTSDIPVVSKEGMDIPVR